MHRVHFALFIGIISTLILASQGQTIPLPLGDQILSIVKGIFDILDLDIFNIVCMPSTLFNVFDNMTPIVVTKNLLLPTFDQARYYIYFAFATYCGNSSNIANWTCEPCRKTSSNVYLYAIVQEPNYNTFALINVDDEAQEVILTFRGTINPINLLGNFDVNLVPTSYAGAPSGVRVHEGFYNASQLLAPLILPLLRNVFNSSGRSDYSLVITGHSLGGSLASLAILYTKEDSYLASLNLNISLITYESTRVGNQAFAQWMNSMNFTSARVTHKADAIPHVYPSSYGYVHFGTELWIHGVDDTNATWCSNTLYEDPSCSNSRGPCYNAQDHIYIWDSNMFACVPENLTPIVLELTQL